MSGPSQRRWGQNPKKMWGDRLGNLIYFKGHCIGFLLLPRAGQLGSRGRRGGGGRPPCHREVEENREGDSAQAVLSVCLEESLDQSVTSLSFPAWDNRKLCGLNSKFCMQRGPETAYATPNAVFEVVLTFCILSLRNWRWSLFQLTVTYQIGEVYFN